MLSSGVEVQEGSHPYLLDSSMSAVVQELYTGLPVSISSELTAGSEPDVRLDAKTEAPTLVLAHSSDLLSEHHRNCRVENCSQETDNLDHGDQLASHGLEQSLSEECMEVGNLAEDEEAESGSLWKQKTYADGYEKEEREPAKETQDAEEELVGCCALAYEEKWQLRQEEPQINQRGGEFSRICYTEMTGHLKSKEENQTNVQVTSEILPKLTEEVQGMKADGTRLFSKAGHRNGRVSKGLPPESNDCPDVGTLMTSGEVPEASTLVPLEPLTVVDTGPTEEHPQKEKEYKRLTACTTTVLLTARDCAIFGSKTGEIKLSVSSLSNTEPTSYQTDQQEEENSSHNYRAVPRSRRSVGVDMPFSKESSDVLCDPFRVLYSQSPDNVPLGDNTTDCEMQEEYSDGERESPSCGGDSQTECLENWIARPVMEKPLSPVQQKELSSDEAEQSETSNCTDHSFSSRYGEPAEIQEAALMKDSCGMNSGHDVQESMRSECSNSSLPPPVPSSREECSKRDQRILSEINNLKRDEDQWQICSFGICSGDVAKEPTKENNTLLMDTRSSVSIETGNVHTCSDNTCSKYGNCPPPVHDFLDFGTKLGEVFFEAQLCVKETDSSSMVKDLDNSFDKAPEANGVSVNLPTCKETNCAYTQAFGHDAEESRGFLGVVNELPSCSADVVLNRDVYLDRLPNKESIVTSAEPEAQSAGLLLRKNEDSSLVNHRNFKTSNVASKDFQTIMHSALEGTKYVDIDKENEHGTRTQNDQNIKDQCSALKTCFISSGNTSLDNATPNKDSCKVQAESMTKEVSGLETDLPVHVDKKTVGFPEANICVSYESVPCEDSWNCSNRCQYRTNRSSTAENPFGSACVVDESTAMLSEVEISETNIEVESWKTYEGHCEITEERVDSGTRESTSDTDKEQEQINSCALQTNEIDRIETVDSIKAHEDSHQNETSEQSLNRDLNKPKSGIHFELCNSQIGLGAKEGKVESNRKKTVLPCEYSLSEGTTSRSDTDSRIPRHEKNLAQSFDLGLSRFKHAKQRNKTICHVENQYLACQSEMNQPVSYKQNGALVADETLEFRQCNLDISNKQISNTGVKITTRSVEEQEGPFRAKENDQLTLKKDEDVTPLVHESLREKSFQGTFNEIVVNNNFSSGMVNADCSEYTDSISDLSEGERVELKKSDDVGISAREHEGPVKENMVGCSSSSSLVNVGYSGYTNSTTSPKEVQREEHTIFAENTKLPALLNMRGSVMVPEHKIKTLAESCTVSQPACKSFLHEPQDMTLLPEVRNETGLFLDSAVNHTIIEINKACPRSELVTFTVTDTAEHVNVMQFEKFCVNEEFSDLKGVTSETPLAQNSEMCLSQKNNLPKPSENTQIIDHDTANALCNDCYSREPLELTASFERRVDDNDSPSEEIKKTTYSLKDAVKLEVSYAHIKERSVSPEDSEPIVKEMDINSSDIDCVQNFKSAYVEDQMEGSKTGEKIKMPMYSIFDDKNDVGVLLEDLKFSCDKVRSCVLLKAKSHEEPSQVYCAKQIPEYILNNLSDKGKTYIKDPSKSGGVKLLSEIIGNNLQSKDLINKETAEFHNNIADINKLSNDTEASLKCLDCSKVCLPYELNSQSKDNSKEIIGDQIKIPCDSVGAKNEVSGAESLDKLGECKTLKQLKPGETELHLAQDSLLFEVPAQQIQQSKYQERVKIPLQECMVFDNDPLGSSSDDLVASSRTMKTEGCKEQVFNVMRNINDGENDQMYSTLQDIKRPKISTDGDSSENMKTMDSEMESLNICLGTHIKLSADNTGFIPISLSLPQANSFVGCDEITGAFGNTHKLRGLFSVRKPPGGICKRVPTPAQLKLIRKSIQVKSSPFLRNSPGTVPTQEHKHLNSVYFACKPPAVETEIAMRLDYSSKQRTSRYSLLNSLKFSKCTKEPALLSRLSAVANKLMALSKGIHGVKTLQCSSELLPVVESFSQLRAKKLLDVFSHINMKLNLTDGLCTKMFNFQPLALYPFDATKIHILDLRSNIPSSVFNTPVSPVSFHIKLDSDSFINFTGIASQLRGVPDRPALGEAPVHPSQPSKWTFSLLLSQSCSSAAAFREDTNLGTELHSSGLFLTTPNHDCRRNPIAKRRAAECSMLGLHTVLALSSPACYRIWTRRRNITSRIPTVQRLFVSQFTQGLKGLRSPTSVSDDLFSSLPYSLGRLLSMWSQHGPSEFTPLHSNHCKWQPRLGIENRTYVAESYAMLPHMTVQGTETARTTGTKIRLESSLSDLLPKVYTFPESTVSPLRRSVSELQVHPFDELSASLPVCPTSQSTTELKKSEPEKRPKRVSQIRIRKTVPKPDPNLTPMGLPRPKRLKKKEFSLEEIYTNKNYKSPPATRCLETIFEEPKEKNGSLISISQQKRKRILEFQDFTVPRKRKARSRVKVAGSFTRAKKAALQGRELDALLIQKLMDLEAFFAEEEDQEQASVS